MASELTPTSRLNPFLLTFREKEAEAAYWNWNLPATKRGTELALLLSSLSFMLLVVVDYLLLGHWEPAVLLVRLVAFPATNALLYFALQNHRFQKPTWFNAVHTFFILNSQCWQFGIAIAYPELGPQYLALNIMLSFLATITFNKLTWRYLMPTITLVWVAFLLTVTYLIDIPKGDLGFQYMLTFMFTGIGITSGYRLERAARLDFVHQRSIAQQEAVLLAKNKELEQFAYIASHDLQEPLRSVTSFSQLINEEYRGQIGEDGSRYLDFLMEASGRMRNLIKGLLDYSRLGREARLSAVDANAVLRDIQVDLSVAIAECGATVTADPLPTLPAYETEFRQLLQNLLSNALKFRRKGVAPVVHVSAQRQGSFWEFAVRDNGIGIAKESQDKIFLIFQRLHNRSQYEGTGIGLANCRKIVELHGGTIRVESEKNQGSTFLFTLPIRPHG